LMGPTEKLTFLESFAFNDIDLGSIKAKCKNQISKSNDELISAKSNLELSQKMIKEIQKPEIVNFPIKCKSSNRDIVISNHSIKIKNNDTLQKKVRKNMANLSAELNSVNLLNATLLTYQETIDESLTNIKLYQDSLSEYQNVSLNDVNSIKSRLNKLKSTREFLSLKDRIKIDEEKFLDMKTSELKSIENRIGDIKKSLWNEGTSEYFREIIQTNRDFLIISDRVINLKISENAIEKRLVGSKSSDELSKLIETLQVELINAEKILSDSTLVLSCPSCDSKLKLDGNTLVKIDKVCDNIKELKEIVKTNKQKISEFKKSLLLVQNDEQKLTEIKDNLAEYDDESLFDEKTRTEIKQSIDDSEEYLKTNLKLEKELQTLENSIKNNSYLSMSCINFGKSLSNLQKQLNEYTDIDISELENEKELSEKLETQLSLLSKKTNIEEKIDRCNDNIRKYTDKIKLANIEFQKTYQTIRKPYEIQEELDNCLKELNILENDKIELLNIQTLIENWLRNEEIRKNYEKWDIMIENYKKEETVKKNEYAAAIALKESILEAESIALVNISETINSHAQIYLDIFFPDNPISVRITPFKQNKNSTTKPQIDVEIDYKGIECDLSMLSTGELSRVILAFTLALSEMFNTPLLLLDECTANLNQELASAVFSGIKENFNGRLTVIIAHQTVTGIFDNIIEL